MSVQKATQGCAQYFDVAYPKKRREDACALRKRPRNVNSVCDGILHVVLPLAKVFGVGVRCVLAPLCAMPPATAKRATRRDSYHEGCCLRIG